MKKTYAKNCKTCGKFLDKESGNCRWCRKEGIQNLVGAADTANPHKRGDSYQRETSSAYSRERLVSSAGHKLLNMRRGHGQPLFSAVERRNSQRPPSLMP